MCKARVGAHALVAGITHRGGVSTPAFVTPQCTGRQMMNARTSSACTQAVSVERFQAFTYYAVFALPQRVLRVRAELPLQTAANEEVPAFAHSLVAALVPKS